MTTPIGTPAANAIAPATVSGMVTVHMTEVIVTSYELPAADFTALGLTGSAGERAEPYDEKAILAGIEQLDELEPLVMASIADHEPGEYSVVERTITLTASQ
ncbi:hypothetical protein SAMN06295974_3832 [Plantibacter flavus]|uniref:Uncharacterized protein n=1 Tax=Plantibacter flavus TaxID=150123 RepID=A0A3N2BLH3_9MICO|nr:hypothetical protein [Plantibacter flavus]ROR76022.1 hypothetical protein EDD42_3974 [Plantibacter flavus]SMG49241.1 hypothetical protein SAMN06295974_3832 [Plantibacter flavus]